MSKIEDLLDEFAEEISSPSGGEFDLDPAQVLENYQLARKYAAQAIEVEITKAKIEELGQLYKIVNAVWSDGTFAKMGGAEMPQASLDILRDVRNLIESRMADTESMGGENR